MPLIDCDSLDLPNVNITPKDDCCNVNLGSTLVGVPVEKIMTIANDGGLPLLISSLAFEDARFVISESDCGDTIPPGEDCTFKVTFTPTGLGTASARLTIVSNEVTSPEYVWFCGVGVESSEIGCATEGLDFGCVSVGEESEAQELDIVNPYTTPLNIFNIELDGDANFLFSHDSLPTVLSPGEGLPVSVTLLASSAAGFVGYLKIISDAPTSPDYILLTGAGCVDEPSFALSLITPDDTSGSTGSADSRGCCKSYGFVRVFNNGNSTEQVNSYTMLHWSCPTPPTGHQIDNIGSPIVLEPGESTVQPFFFRPQGVGTCEGQIRVGTSLGDKDTAHFITEGLCFEPIFLYPPLIELGAHKKSNPQPTSFDIVLVNTACPTCGIPASLAFFNPTGTSLSPGFGALIGACANYSDTVSRILTFPYTLDPGPYSANLSITWDCGCASGEFSIALTGTILPEDP
jgi:hypothetical protein